MAYVVWFKFLFIFLFLKYGSCQEYRAGFASGAESCEDFDNKVFDCTGMYLTPMEDDDDEDASGFMCIEGLMELTQELDENVMINIEVSKYTDKGTEPMFSSAIGLGDAIKEKDAPWSPMFEAMDIKEAPVGKGKFNVKNMAVDLRFCEKFLNDKMKGDYVCRVQLVNRMTNNALSCHNLNLCIIEV